MKKKSLGGKFNHTLKDIVSYFVLNDLDSFLHAMNFKKIYIK